MVVLDHDSKLEHLRQATKLPARYFSDTAAPSKEWNRIYLLKKYPTMPSKPTSLAPDQLQSLEALVGPEHVLTSSEHRLTYGKDQTLDWVYPPAAVVRPANAQEVSAVLRWAYAQNIPVTPRGAGTGLAGGALPVTGGLVVSTERLNQILDLDVANLQVTTEPGVLTQVLQETVEAQGLYYPPDPSSRGSSYIGGNVATNAGGPRAVKYGVVKDYVINLQVVLPQGDLIWTGAHTLKNSTGYQLTQLLVGSEGTLGIITQIVLKLLPRPHHNLLLLASFGSVQQASAAVSAIFRAGVVPSALEFMERRALELAAAYVGTSAPLGEDVQAQLLIEVDGNHLDSLYADCETLDQVLQAHDCLEVLFADDAATQNKLWTLRRNLNPAIKQHAKAMKKADTVVPRAALPELLAAIHRIGAEHGIRAVNYGHAGDGNVHVTLMQEEQSDEHWAAHAPVALRAIFEAVADLRGTISGEHGIGYLQKEHLPLVFSPAALQLQRAIKQAFDPKGLLNPQKLF